MTDEEWENIPEVGNLTRKKRKRDERSFVVPDSVLVGDRSRGEYENALDAQQQAVSTVVRRSSSYAYPCIERRIRNTGRKWYFDEFR